MSPRSLRVVRGSSAAAFATFVALLSHVAGGGAMPGPVGIVAPLVLSIAAGTLLAGRALSFWRLGVTVGISQVLFHTLFVLGTITPTTAIVAPAHDHSAALLALTGHTGASAAVAGAAMWTAHAIAAVLTVAAFSQGERALRRLATIAVTALQWARRRVPAVPAPRVRVRVPAPSAPADLRSSVWRGRLPRRRGPPLLAAL